jgi:hypothetical protein
MMYKIGDLVEADYGGERIEGVIIDNKYVSSIYTLGLTKRDRRHPYNIGHNGEDGEFAGTEYEGMCWNVRYNQVVGLVTETGKLELELLALAV